MEARTVDHAWVSVYDCACHGTHMEVRECSDSWFSRSAIWVLGIIRRWSALAASASLLSHLALPLIIDLLIFSAVFTGGLPAAEYIFSACPHVPPHSL